MFVFGWPILRNLGTLAEQNFSRQIMKIWGSFARSGRPNISDLPIDFTVSQISLVI